MISWREHLEYVHFMELYEISHFYWLISIYPLISIRSTWNILGFLIKGKESITSSFLWLQQPSSLNPSKFVSCWFNLGVATFSLALSEDSYSTKANTIPLVLDLTLTSTMVPNLANDFLKSFSVVLKIR